MVKKILITGHFSTVGDIACLKYVLKKIDQYEFDVIAFHPSVNKFLEFSTLKCFNKVKPKKYSHLILVCGPIYPSFLVSHGLDISDFSHCVTIGINLSLIQPLSLWNPFDHLYERDSSENVRPDLALASYYKNKYLIGICLIESQKEYGDLQLHKKTVNVVKEFSKTKKYTFISIDSKLSYPENSFCIKDEEDFLSIINKFDLLITNRLHGMIFSSLLNLPTIAIDSVLERGKVTSQANFIKTSHLINARDLSVEYLCKQVDSMTRKLQKVNPFTLNSVDKESLFSALDPFITKSLNHSSSDIVRKSNGMNLASYLYFRLYYYIKCIRYWNF